MFLRMRSCLRVADSAKVLAERVEAGAENDRLQDAIKNL